jgi:glucosyl-dolichyl phosphate glucuronosyltransferase
MKDISDISVVVCTHRVERWPQLVACLASLASQSLQPLEVIVVVDGEPELSRRLYERAGQEITLSTAHPSGLSVARNLGLAHASGKFVAFLDDDAVADQSWLKCLRAVTEDETVAGVGGVSQPNWEGTPPKWMPEELLWTVGCSFRGMPVIQADVRNVYGGSACYRREIFGEFGGFNSRLGRMAVGLAGCEETELCLRVRNRSPELRFVHEPAAIIHHRVPRERQKVSYILSRCLAEGRSKAILYAIIGGNGKRPLAREANYLARTVPSGISLDIAQFLRGDVWGFARALVLAIAVMSTLASYEAARIRGILVRPLRRPDSPEIILAYPPEVRLSGSDGDDADLAYGRVAPVPPVPQEDG